MFYSTCISDNSRVSVYHRGSEGERPRWGDVQWMCNFRNRLLRMSIRALRADAYEKRYTGRNYLNTDKRPNHANEDSSDEVTSVGADRLVTVPAQIEDLGERQSQKDLDGSQRC